MFRASSCPSSGAYQLQQQPLLYSRNVVVAVLFGRVRAGRTDHEGRAGRSARTRTQHDCHYETKVKPDAATAVIELMMMGGKTAETCSAVNIRQDNKLKNFCIRLVIYLNEM
jgi:hypothetical protein